MNKHQQSLADAGHEPSTRKRMLGMTPIRPSRPVYGTSLRCECGWRFQTNESPTKGGTKQCLEAWQEHAEQEVKDAS